MVSQVSQWYIVKFKILSDCGNNHSLVPDVKSIPLFLTLLLSLYRKLDYASQFDNRFYTSMSWIGSPIWSTSRVEWWNGLDIRNWHYNIRRQEKSLNLHTISYFDYFAWRKQSSYPNGEIDDATDLNLFCYDQLYVIKQHNSTVPELRSRYHTSWPY